MSLLDGVTGSGKTEVYLEAAAEALRLDKSAQVLVLLPEIALTQAAMSRFEARFGATPVEWHSAIAHKARRRAWREVAAGRARLIVGARSALFLPFPNLKLIVIDEEHDSSYKQEEGVIYQARDLAVARAKLGDCAVILASATPSLETLVNAQAGRYAHVKLPSRHGGAELPDVALIDMKLDPPEKGRWISPKLIRAAGEALIRGEQALFYMNRRGYAPLNAMSRVWAPHEIARQRCLAGRAPLYRPAGLPSHWLFDAQAESLPGMSCTGRLHLDRPWRRAHRGRGAEFFPRSADRDLFIRHHA